jgi:hypothetical protein
MSEDEKRPGGDRRSKKERRSGIDTRSDEAKRLSGERRSKADRRTGPDRRSDAKKVEPERG